METPTSDTGFIQWLINALAGLGLLVTGWMNFRINKMEDETKTDLRDHREDIYKEMTRVMGEYNQTSRSLWERIEESRASLDTFKQHVLMSMVTKDDLRGMKDDLMEAIKANT